MLSPSLGHTVTTAPRRAFPGLSVTSDEPMQVICSSHLRGVGVRRMRAGVSTVLRRETFWLAVPSVERTMSGAILTTSASLRQPVFNDLGADSNFMDVDLAKRLNLMNPS